MADPYAAAVAVATATSQALAAAATGSSSSYPFPQRNMDNVVQNNEALMLDGHRVYELSRVKDLLLRTSAATLLVCLLVVWLQTFSNKRSAVSLLVAATIATELIGVIVGLLPKISTLLPNTPLLSVVVGVGCFMFSAECFNWVLYLRFSIVAAPFAKGRFTRVLVRTWLGVESAMVIANYAYWIQQSYAEDGNTHAANDVYYYLSIIQAATALGLSSYFVATYYYPRLKLTARQSGGGGGVWALVAQFATTGLLYLVLETLLHCSYTVTSKLLPSVRTGLTAFLTAARYATFMMFVLALRSDTAAGRRRRSRLLLPLRERKLSSPLGRNGSGGEDDLEIIRHNSHDAAPKQQNNKQQQQQQSHQHQQQQRRRWPFFPSTSPDTHRGGFGRPQMGKAHKPSAANYLYHNHHRQQHLRREEVDPKGTFEDWSIDMEPDDLTILRPAPAATTGGDGMLHAGARAGEFAR